MKQIFICFAFLLTGGSSCTTMLKGKDETGQKNSKMHLVANWYQVREVRPQIFLIEEPEHVMFYALVSNHRALLIDSGLGLSLAKSEALLKELNVTEFEVLNTHAHVDHVGLNHLATSVSISKREWEKYQSQKEYRQLSYYWKSLRTELSWPDDVNQEPKVNLWKPRHFVSAGDTIHFGTFSILVLSFPGHTKGSLCFFENSTKTLFLGDFLYNGTLYLHLQDSSFSEFQKSLTAVEAFVKSHPGIMLLPSHNDSPLDIGYLNRLDSVLKDILQKKLTPTRGWPKDELFEDASVFEVGDVKIAIKKVDLPK